MYSSGFFQFAEVGWIRASKVLRSILLFNADSLTGLTLLSKSYGRARSAASFLPRGPILKNLAYAIEPRAAEYCSKIKRLLRLTLSPTGLPPKQTHLANTIICGSFSDFKKELRALNRELQLHILELADILVERPSQYARRVEEISLIFKNLHHLLNSLRPHQARATLIHILELQIERRRQAVEDIKRRREEAQRLLMESLETLDGH
ncbi:mediator of RNA polymerase II transcription subunit 7-like [Benincasa hispida]|uniref:mediator of RNA polymerase II transcription subunit 7-like n=1 Tax=Benincasa hispida TaxID=102211 RepID=UPI0019025AFD|nr:mediator of RNA polymerase II transcription subunit 7-like [Benincasa hispida]